MKDADDVDGVGRRRYKSDLVVRLNMLVVLYVLGRLQMVKEDVVGFP